MAQDQHIETEKFDPRIYIGIIFFRWKFIVLCILLCLLGGVLYSTFAPKEYLTKCTVMIWRDPLLAVSQEASAWRSMQAHIWLLEGEEMRDRTIDRLKDKWRERLGGLRQMEERVEAQPIRGQGSMLQISVRNSRPEYAVEYLDTLWHEFQDKQAYVRGESSGAASRMLDEELGRLEERVGEAEEDIADYARLNQMDITSARGDIERRYLAGLLSHQNKLSTEMMLLESLFPMLRGEDAVVVGHVDDLTRQAGSVSPVDEIGDSANGETRMSTLSGPGTERIAAETPEMRDWSRMKAERATLEMRKKLLLGKFTPEHPEVQEISRQLSELDEKLRVAAEVSLGRLKDRLAALKITWNALESAIRTWKNTHQLASQKQAGYRRLQLARDRRESMYKNLYGRLHDLKVSEELKADHFVMMAPVKTEENPVWPNIPKVMLMALVLALGSGFGVATLAHLFDNRMQTISDVESALGMTFLGGIPRWVRKGSAALARPIVLDEHSSGAVEAYRALRTGILKELKDKGQNTIMLTSAESGEGKTITALNLAVMIAQAGSKVLLVDMDLRRPRLHRALGLERAPGVTDVLKGEHTLGDLVTQTTIPNLWFVPAGSLCEQAAELLQKSDLVALFAKARSEYDYVILDTSPILRTTDASIIATPELCSVVMVVHVDRAAKPIVKYALDFLGNARILGVVMNNIEMNKISSLYYSYQYPNYAYYAYAYSYGYDYDYFYGEGGPKKRKKRLSLRKALRNLSERIRRTIMPLE